MSRWRDLQTQACGETGRCGLPAGFFRLRYFYGKQLRLADYVDEQLYHSGKMRFHNRHLHGAGLMCGLKVPTHGVVEYKGRALAAMTERERDELRLSEFGFVFQYPYLIGYLSALENVIVAQPSTGLRDEAMELLRRLDVADKASRLPHELSGGERQRVCVARALLGGSHVIFADEPTAALDHTSGVQVMSLLAEHRGEGALVVVTHDPSMLEKADRVVTIRDGAIQ